MEKLMTSRDAAAIISPGSSASSADTIMCRHRREGTGPRYLKIGSRFFYRSEDIRAWLERHLVDGEVA